MNSLVTPHDIRQARLEAERAARGGPGAEPTPPGPLPDELNQQTQRLQSLIEQLDGLADPAARALARAAVEALLQWHGRALARVLEILAGQDGAAEKLRAELLQDPLVRGLLLIHGLHPVDLATRLGEALAKVRPYMESHGGSVEVVSLQGGVAKLRLQGTCKGCPSSAATLELAIKQALEEACPDLVELQVEGVVAASAPPLAPKPGAPRWRRLEGFGQLRDGDLQSLEVSGVALVICKVRGSLYAYHNECPACGLALEDGRLENETLRCRLGHRFDVRRAGQSPDNPDVHLDPFPLLAEGDVVKVAVRPPAAAPAGEEAIGRRAEGARP